MADSKVYSVEQALKELEVDVSKLTLDIQLKAKEAIRQLSIQAHARIVELATSRLKSTRNTYIENLGITSEGDSIHVVYLKKDAAWIEDGIPQGEMIDRILNGGKPAKINSKGQKYKTIPFEHSKRKQDMSLAQQRIAAFAKSEIKKAGLDKTIMKDGKPVIGRAATLNITGPNAPVSKFNRPILAGLTIYQREHKTTTGKTQIKRDIFTFRTISESQKGSGLWVHPGLRGAKLFEEVSREIDALWSKMIGDIVEESVKSLKGVD